MRWATIPLKRIAVLTAGGTPAVAEPTYWSDGDEGHAWVSISDMSSVDSVTTTTRRVSDAGLRSARIALGDPGTLLFSMYASLGHTAWLSSPAAWNQAILGLRADSTTDPRFLRYSLVSLRPTLLEQARSNTQSNLNAEQVGNLAIPRPPLDMQCRIADFLDSETVRIDRMVSAREKQIAILEECEYAEVTEGLIPGSLTSASGKWPWVWLPDPRGDAPLVRLGYIARLQSGLTVDGKRDLSGDVVTRPYLRVANVQADRIQVDDVSDITVPAYIAKRSTLLSGDVLMTEGGDLDKLGRGTVWRGELEECLHQNHVFAVRPDALKLDADYLSLMTRTVHGRCYFESTGVKTTNLASTNSSKILGFPIPLPKLEIQRSRVQAVQRKLDGSARIKQRLRAQLELLAERRQALITAAVTGQLDVTTTRPTHDHGL